MKKFFIITALLFCLQIFSQKSVEIYNFTNQTLRISSIFTKPLTSDFPWCASVSPSFISIDPGDSYVLENTSNIYRFPFYSPNSPTLITNWRRVLEPATPGGNSNWSNITSNTAWVLGNNQYFNYLEFSMYSGNQYNGSGYIGNLNFWVTANPLTNATYQWEIIHDNFTNGTTIIDTIVVYSI